MSEFREGFVGENPDGPTVEETVFKNLVDRKFPESRSKYESLFKKKMKDDCGLKEKMRNL